MVLSSDRLASKVLPVPGSQRAKRLWGCGPDRGEAFRLFEERLLAVPCFIDASNVVKGNSSFGFHLEEAPTKFKALEVLLERRRNNSIKAINGKIHSS